MGIFDFFKHKCGYTQKGLTFEDCIVKMFSSSGISPNREGNKFATEVEGKHCVIGANSVVTKDIPDYSVAVGAPAKVIKQYNATTNQWEKV